MAVYRLHVPKPEFLNMVLVQRKAETIQEEREGQSSSQNWAGQCCSGKGVETWIVWVLSLPGQTWQN